METVSVIERKKYYESFFAPKLKVYAQEHKAEEEELNTLVERLSKEGNLLMWLSVIIAAVSFVSIIGTIIGTGFRLSNYHFLVFLILIAASVFSCVIMYKVKKRNLRRVALAKEKGIEYKELKCIEKEIYKEKHRVIYGESDHDNYYVKFDDIVYRTDKEGYELLEEGSIYTFICIQDDTEPPIYCYVK